MPKPKILFFDIETCGVNALKSDLGFVILFGYKWAHQRRAKVLKISKNALRNFDDRELLIKASRLIEQADVVVGHFASVFDRRFIQGRLLIHDLPPIPPTKLRDTCMIARSVANYSSNRLKHLAKILDLENQKLSNDWPMAWFRVMQGDMGALNRLARYCKGDVMALQDLYNRLRAFDNPHPALVLDRSKCGICGGEIEYRGFMYVRNHRYRRFVCKSCHHWGRENKASDS